jgi:hypothetical protein
LEDPPNDLRPHCVEVTVDAHVRLTELDPAAHLALDGLKALGIG